MSLILSKFPGQVAGLTGELNAARRELLPLCMVNFSAIQGVCQVFFLIFTYLIIKRSAIGETPRNFHFYVSVCQTGFSGAQPAQCGFPPKDKPVFQRISPHWPPVPAAIPSPPHSDQNYPYPSSLPCLFQSMPRNPKSSIFEATPPGIIKGETEEALESEYSIRFPLETPEESEEHAEVPRRLFAYFLAGEKVWPAQIESSS